MGSIIAFANQKGGVAKTTTVHTFKADERSFLSISTLRPASLMQWE